MKLYTHALSPFSAKVRIALHEKKLSYEEIPLPITRAGIVEKPRELLAVNPRGEVPTLLDGEVRLYDSTVILEYLEDRHPTPPLLPASPAARALARQLEDHADWLLATCLGDLIGELFRKTDPSEQDAAVIERAREATRRGLDVLEEALGDGEFLAGALSLADVSCFTPVRFASFFGVAPETGHPRVAAWLSRLLGRPAFAKEVDTMNTALASLS